MSKCTQSFTSELIDRVEGKVLAGARRLLLIPSCEVSARIRQILSTFDCGLSIIECEWPTTSEVERRTAKISDELLDEIDLIVVCSDASKVSVLSALNQLPWRRLPDVVVAGTGHQEASGIAIAEFARASKTFSHATGYDGVQSHLFDCLSWLSRRHNDGLVCEFGSFRGGTALLIRKILDHLGSSQIEVHAFDTFDGFPPRRCLLDIFNNPRFEDRSKHSLVDRLRGANIVAHVGDIVETCSEVSGEKLLMCFFDTDNYSPTSRALTKCANSIVPGGILLFDHYFTRADYMDTIGERVAIEEFQYSHPEFFNPSGTGLFIKCT